MGSKPIEYEYTVFLSSLFSVYFAPISFPHETAVDDVGLGFDNIGRNFTTKWVTLSQPHPYHKSINLFHKILFCPLIEHCFKSLRQAFISSQMWSFRRNRFLTSDQKNNLLCLVINLGTGAISHFVNAQGNTNKLLSWIMYKLNFTKINFQVI